MKKEHFDNFKEGEFVRCNDVASKILSIGERHVKLEQTNAIGLIETIAFEYVDVFYRMREQEYMMNWYRYLKSI